MSALAVSNANSIPSATLAQFLFNMAFPLEPIIVYCRRWPALSRRQHSSGAYAARVKFGMALFRGALAASIRLLPSDAT
ncbi:hypothetical protein JM946_21855 [Steroidobacter sp. S1-65]|uniref:Uncharacterized protein n=1 Tax=Steroidobacter gossypii TaxID=2805490 RepID=A0ABS1X2D3_9GAMM|nr:hypothetical protein [Steroidobacter gossypii]MBM0107393.1 hypothetical protein [Steroidobacter gossypii]